MITDDQYSGWCNIVSVQSYNAINATVGQVVFKRSWTRYVAIHSRIKPRYSHT